MYGPHYNYIGITACAHVSPNKMKYRSCIYGSNAPFPFYSYRCMSTIFSFSISLVLNSSTAVHPCFFKQEHCECIRSRWDTQAHFDIQVDDIKALAIPENVFLCFKTSYPSVQGRVGSYPRSPIDYYMMSSHL